MDAQTEAMMKQHANLVTASLAAAESMVFEARNRQRAIELDAAIHRGRAQLGIL